MINLRNIVTACAFGLAVVAVASPAMAKSRANQPGHSARAQAVESQDGLPSARASAIRECSGKANSFSQTTWGMTQSAMYRSCMMERGHME